MHFKWEILPIDDHNQGLFPKIRALFSNLRKRAGETSPPPLPPLVTRLHIKIRWKSWLGVSIIFYFYNSLFFAKSRKQQTLKFNIQYSKHKRAFMFSIPNSCFGEILLMFLKFLKLISYDETPPFVKSSFYFDFFSC